MVKNKHTKNAQVCRSLQNALVSKVDKILTFFERVPNNENNIEQKNKKIGKMINLK